MKIKKKLALAILSIITLGASIVDTHKVNEEKRNLNNILKKMEVSTSEETNMMIDRLLETHIKDAMRKIDLEFETPNFDNRYPLAVNPELTVKVDPAGNFNVLEISENQFNEFVKLAKKIDESKNVEHSVPRQEEIDNLKSKVKKFSRFRSFSFMLFLLSSFLFFYYNKRNLLNILNKVVK